ncbi:uncharacterized protein [Drosophila virilis]|uniref:Uncharacterized protein, isoform D n=1 Tax=Drosophila virilis TaxID=7244 RepID=A0A0Q9WSB2_DROVI|nr:uncharacterized protein LOC6622053 isoform X3 [Drosophila virilis]XP_032289934.1 uncharacterized protein LOC116649732 isoform X2 [Drosophila virilis]KRF85127.1 uncharacterized protein Dvir_GJ11338, isoform D [Drosophila virilis]
MCACGAENFSSFYPGCNAGPPKTCDCGRSGSAVVQETKFSNMIPPSFLCNRISNTTKKKEEKPKPCSCPTKKTDKVPKKCKCVDKGVDTCDLENEVCKNACEMSNTDYTNMIAAHEPVGVNPTLGQGTAIPTIGIGNDVPGAAFMGAMDRSSNVLDMNLEQPQRIEAMPAAGLPSRTCPQFDPCTGLERQCPFKPAPQAAYMPYMGPVIPLPSLSPYFYPNFQCCQKPTQGPCCCAPSVPLPECACDAGASTTETTNTRDKVEKPKNNKRNKDKLRQPNGKSKEKTNKELQIVNCCNASSDLIERICTSLQVPRPPESCYLLLPIKMATDGNEEFMQPDGKQQNEKVDSPRRSKDGANGSQPAKKCNKPTRNCGCNTVISGNLQDNGEDPQEEEDEENNNPSGNCCNSCCSPARCCWPCCYYNPCTALSPALSTALSTALSSIVSPALCPMLFPILPLTKESIRELQPKGRNSQKWFTKLLEKV